MVLEGLAEVESVGLVGAGSVRDNHLVVFVINKTLKFNGTSTAI